MAGQMEGQGAFVAARDECHIIGQLVLQAIQAADQAQGGRGEIRHAHPVENHEARIDHNEMTGLVLLRMAPADQAVPTAQIARHRREQQTPQDPLLLIADQRPSSDSRTDACRRDSDDSRPTRSRSSPPRDAPPAGA